MTDVTPPTAPPAALPVARHARPGGRRASWSRRGPLIASLALHAVVLVVGTVAFRRPPRAGSPEAIGTVAFDLSPEVEPSVDAAPEVLEDVEVEPMPPVGDLEAPAPDDAPLPLDPTPVMDEDVAPDPAPPTPVPAPADPMRRTRRPPPVSAPSAAPPSPPAVVPSPPPRGARPPLVAVASPSPPLVPGGAPGTTLVVVLEYTIGPDGVVTDAVVRGSSGSEALDASTRAFVLARWRYAPPGEPRRVARRFVFNYGG